MGKTGRLYSPEFKEEAVRLVHYCEERYPVAKIARDLDVSAETLRKWVNQAYTGLVSDWRHSKRSLATSPMARLARTPQETVASGGDSQRVYCGRFSPQAAGYKMAKASERRPRLRTFHEEHRTVAGQAVGPTRPQPPPVPPRPPDDDD
ncbi:MAG: transposase [Actinobacteria bacterium]|nr:transposase [Actinomycetota bacterium]